MTSIHALVGAADGALEADVRRGEAVRLVEAMRVDSIDVARQLDAVAPARGRPVDGGTEQRRPDAVPAVRGIDVEALDLGLATLVLMGEVEHLAHAEHVAPRVRDEHLAALAADPWQGRDVARWCGNVFSTRLA